MPYIENIDGQYVLNRSCVRESKEHRIQRGEPVVVTHWKMSSYVNCLSKHGFKIERLIEDSIEVSEDVPFTEKYYSEHKAQYIDHTFIVQARKL